MDYQGGNTISTITAIGIGGRKAAAEARNNRQGGTGKNRQERALSMWGRQEIQKMLSAKAKSASMNDYFASLPLIEIYTDGGCEPNPGSGGYGVVLLHPKTNQRKEAHGGFRLTTNNRMEIYAAIGASKC
jgi:ribonuclease HI